eukprot:4195311-Prymnesium_polylepis.1
MSVAPAPAPAVAIELGDASAKELGDGSDLDSYFDTRSPNDVATVRSGALRAQRIARQHLARRRLQCRAISLV